MFRLTTLSLTLLALLAVAFTARPAVADASTKADSVLSKLADYRADKGLKAVKSDRAMNRAAKSHARTLSRREALKHRSGTHLLKVSKARWTGEILAYAASPAAALRAWVKSPPHHRILKSSKAKRVGVAVHRGVYVVHFAGAKKR